MFQLKIKITLYSLTSLFLSLTQSYQLKALALISTQKKTSHPNLIFYMPESKAKSKKPEYSRGYINLSEALSKPFFKNDEAAIFTPDTIQRNDRKGLLEINYYETLYNNELSVVYDSKGKSEEFYFFFCSQFFDSKLFKSFKIKEKYTIQLCKRNTQNQGFNKQIFLGKPKTYGSITHFKIHLQPQPKYHMWTFFKFLKFLEQNPKIESFIPSFKTNLQYIRQTLEKGTALHNLNGIMPNLIIYLNTEDQKEVELILKSIKDFFEPYASTVGSRYVPRLNFNLNKLVNFSLGHGDHKIDQIIILKELQKLLEEKSVINPRRFFSQLKISASTKEKTGEITNAETIHNFIRDIETDVFIKSITHYILKRQKRTKQEIFDYIRYINLYVPVLSYQADVYDEKNFALLNKPEQPYEPIINILRESLGKEKSNPPRPDSTGEENLYKALRTSLEKSLLNLLTTKNFLQKLKLDLEKMKKVLSGIQRESSLKQKIITDSPLLKALVQKHSFWFYYKEIERLHTDLSIYLPKAAPLSKLKSKNLRKLKTILEQLKKDVQLKDLSPPPVWFQRFYLKTKMIFRYEQDFLTLRKKALLVSTQRQWRNKLKKRKALLNFKKNYGKGCPCVTPCLKSFCYITKHEFYGKGPGEGCSSFKEQGRLSQALNRKWYRACFPEEEN